MPVFSPIPTGFDAADILMMRDELHEVFPYQEVVRILWGGSWHYYGNSGCFEDLPFNNIYEWIGRGIRSTITGTITTAGDVLVIVQRTGMAGSPLSINVPVLVGDTATVVAAKIRLFLTDNETIRNEFAIGGARNEITLERIYPGAEDPDWNMAIGGLGTGLNDTPNSTAGKIEVRLPKNWFAKFKIATIIEDNSADFEFEDKDDSLRDKHRQYGEGARVEVCGYWPTITASNPNGMFRRLWWGILGTPDKADQGRFKVKAKANLKSPKLNLTRGIIYPGCQRIFGSEFNPATDTPFFTDQEMIDDHGCPSNWHLGGSFGVTGHKHCNRLSLADCIEHLGDEKARKFYGGYDKIQAVLGKTAEGYAAGANLNPSILRTSLGVTYGVAFIGDLRPLIYNPLPGQEFFSTLWPVSWGPVEGAGPQYGMFYFQMEDKFVPTQNTGKQAGVYGAEWIAAANRAGGELASRFSSIAANELLGSVGFSLTAYVYCNVKKTDFPDFDPRKVKASCVSNGAQVRRYTDPDSWHSWSRAWSNNRAWCTFDLVTNKMYGLGYDRKLFVLSDWTALADWCDHSVLSYTTFSTDEDGTSVPSLVTQPRSTLNVHIRNRKAGDTIKAICSAGNIGTPFFWNGQIRVVGLGLEDVSANIPQPFTQEAETYGFKNIKPGSLTYIQKGQEELTNVLKVNFTEQVYPAYTGQPVQPGDTQSGISPLFPETPLVYDDQIQQLRAGLALGDTTLVVTEKSFDAFGVSNVHEGLRIGAMVFDLGEQERGGAANNLTVTFTTWHSSSDGIQLHPFKVIEILDTGLQKYMETIGKPFKYFRVLDLERGSDRTLNVTCQGYPLEYYKALEDGEFIRPLAVMTRGIFAPRLPQKVARPTSGRPLRDSVPVIIRPSR